MSRHYGKKKQPTARRAKKYKRPPRSFRAKRGKWRPHRLHWLQDKYAHRGQKYTRGHLHRHYGIPLGDEIPLKLLVRDQHKPGKLGYQVRFALGRRGYYSK